MYLLDFLVLRLLGSEDKQSHACHRCVSICPVVEHTAAQRTGASAVDRRVSHRSLQAADLHGISKGPLGLDGRNGPFPKVVLIIQRTED